MTDSGGDERLYSRRDVLRGGATLGVASMLSVGSVGAKPTEGGRTEPEHIYYDQAVLDEYAPRLITTDLEFTPSLYGFVADGATAGEDTSVCVYACEYPYQVGYTPFDSHSYDHEWYYVTVRNIGTADAYIERVDYCAYHWIRGTTRDPPTTSGGNPVAYVYARHHHYSHQQARARFDAAPSSAEAFTVEDLRPEYQSWLVNGLDDPLASDVVYNPWLMHTRESWWDDRGALTFNTFLARAFSSTGFFGSDGIDL